MIRLDGVSVRYGDRTVLREVTLSLAEKRIGIVGSNGSGKSTLARLLNGLLMPTAGTVTVDGLDTRSAGRQVRRKVGFVFQNPDNQIVYPTVEEDVAFGLKNLKLGKREIAEKVSEVLAAYSLEEFRQHPSHLLSGGQKQLLALAGVMVMKPQYIVLDEPTTLLDHVNRRRFMRAIHELAESVVVVTHDLDAIRDFERVIVINEGRVVADDRAPEALEAYLRLVS